MRRRAFCALLPWVLLLSACASVGTRRTDLLQAPAAWDDHEASRATAAFFAAHRERPTIVRAFLQRFPKGADLHTHFSGAVYAESYLKWAAAAGSCADPESGKIEKCDEQGRSRPVEEAFADSTFYNFLIDALSTRGLEGSGLSGHEQFFGAFPKLDAGEVGDYVAEVVARAASQHTFYIEGMLTVRGRTVTSLGRKVGLDQSDLAGTRTRLLALGLDAEVTTGRLVLDGIENHVQKVLGCAGPLPQAGCAVTRRYLQQTIRTGMPEEVFAQLVYAFELASRDPRVVGINLVAPEDHPTALRDYTLHMQMIAFLKTLQPQVNVALHAGELSFGLVPPEHLRFHIRQAIEIARARRIGHGVDFFYEDGALDLLATLRDQEVLIEICLTSNDVILGVEGHDHPLPDFLAAGVPTTLASDDEGISRIDLSHEYQRAATTYGLDYPTLKVFARNSLTYSFLPGRSLWQTQRPLGPVAACAQDRPGTPRSPACATFLADNLKAQEQWRLEEELIAFETLPWRRP